MTESLDDAKSRPPLRARLHRYLLTTGEFALLTAMTEHCSDGSTIRASIPRLAAYAKLTTRHAQRIIHGYADPKGKKTTPGLIERGILTELAPPNATKRRSAIYRLNEEALQLDPRMRRYLNQEAQRMLPGILKPAKPTPPVRPVSDATPSRHHVTSPLTPHHQPPVTPCHRSPDTMSADSRPFDSKAIGDPQAGIHHADTTLNSLPVWLATKEALRSELPAEEWALWVRPMYLLKAHSDGTGKPQHLLAALPPDSRIISAAQARLPLLRELLAPAGVTVSLTRYPDEWEIEEAKRRYGVDIAPRPWRES